MGKRSLYIDAVNEDIEPKNNVRILNSAMRQYNT